MLAAQAIAKYAGFVILEQFSPDFVYPLLVLRQNIYTDPQKPIQITPGLYEINAPGPESPVLVTTNFSITYFSVANEVEGSGLPAWLLVTDAEGMSVLTAWAAGKFDAERIAKAVKTFNVASKVSKKRIVLPGHVAVLSGELEGELADWEVRVGPREAVDLPGLHEAGAEVRYPQPNRLSGLAPDDPRSKTNFMLLHTAPFRQQQPPSGANRHPAIRCRPPGRDRDRPAVRRPGPLRALRGAGDGGRCAPALHAAPVRRGYRPGLRRWPARRWSKAMSACMSPSRTSSSAA